MKLLPILLFIFSLNIYAKSEVLSSKVAFLATGRPAFIKASGEMKIENANIKYMNGMLSGEFIVDLNKLDSGIALRDTHLKDKYLEVAKYPLATITFNNVKILVGNEDQSIKGKLNLHGIDKSIDIHIKVLNEKGVFDIKANFNLILTDYQIELPSFRGITAANKVMIEVESKMKL